MHDHLAAVAGEGRGDREQAVPESFRFPPSGLMRRVRQQPRPGSDLGGEGDDGGPDPVLIEPVQGQVAQPGVFRVPDTVLAARPATVAQLERGVLPTFAVGGERGQPVSVDVVEPELRAGVGAFPTDDHAHVFRPAVQVEQAGQLGDIGAGTRVLVTASSNGGKRTPSPSAVKVTS